MNEHIYNNVVNKTSDFTETQRQSEIGCTLMRGFGGRGAEKNLEWTEEVKT